MSSSSSSSEINNQDDCIKAGQAVVIKLHDEKSYYIIKVIGEQKIDKQTVSVKNLIGHPYHSIFELNNKDVTYIDNEEEFILESTINDDNNITNTDQSTNNRGDNSKYTDTNTAQKLTKDDITKLKESGITGNELIQTLINNSETWNTKTSYAQEKW